MSSASGRRCEASRAPQVRHEEVVDHLELIPQRLQLDVNEAMLADTLQVPRCSRDVAEM